MVASDLPAIQVSSLRKRYGEVVAVDGVSFEVEQGSVFCMIGPNGAGKTTTIECIEGLRRPDSGSIRVAGLDPIEGRSELAGKIGVQLQESGVPTRMKPQEALRLFGSMYANPLPLSELSAELDLEDCLSKTYGTFGRSETPRQHRTRARRGSRDFAVGRTDDGFGPRIAFPVLALHQAEKLRGDDGGRDDASDGRGAGIL